MKFKVVDIRTDDHGNIIVDWEDENANRERFSYPPGEGWDEEGADGELSCIKHSRKRLEERIEARKNSKSDSEIEDLKRKHVGRKFDMVEKQEITSGLSDLEASDQDE